MLKMLPESVRAQVLRVVAWVTALSRPAKVLGATTLATAVILAAFVSIRSANPPYAVLFTNLERDDAAAVVAKLKEMKVPFRLENEGATIEVPEAQARELRLELAGGGLPRGGAVGFESFDKMRLGATEFEQRILYRRALEGELSRTIGSLASVQSARVHLVLPEKSVFVSRNEPASASVVVKLRSGRTLGGGEVQSIVHLVSSSVAGLSPEKVALVSTDGTVLHKPRRTGEDASGGSDDERAGQARSLEATLEERARAMVEKMVGAGHVDVRVSAELDTSRTERVEDHYDPKSAVVRSEERTVERGVDDPGATGVPGAESNLPNGSAKPGAPAAAAAADGGAPAAAPTAAAASTPGSTRESHTRNFEVDHVVEKRFIAAGSLRRMTVAVVVDGLPSGAAPRSREEMDKISALVRSAVGADERRGDVVTVESMPFLGVEPTVAVAPAPAPAVDIALVKKHWKIAAGAAGALLLVLVLLVLMVRSRIKKARARAAAAAAAKAAEEKKPLAVSEPTEDDVSALEPTSDELRQRVQDQASRDPATAALVLRGWLSEVTATEVVTHDKAA